MARNKHIQMTYKGSANNAVEAFVKDVQRQLDNRVITLEKDLERVLDVVEEVSQRLIPEDTQKARGSFFREVKREGDKIVARAGYGRDEDVPYLVYIHEFTPKNGFQKPGAEIRFLAKGFEQAALRIDQILGSSSGNS